MLDRRQLLIQGVLGLAAATAARAGPEANGATPRPPAPSAPEPKATEAFWSKVRGEFLLGRDWVHLACLSLSSHPGPVRAAIDRHRRGLDENAYLYIHENYDRLEQEVYQAALAYTGSQPGGIALTDSTTMGVGLLYGGLVLKPGEELLSTEHDHYVTHEAVDLKAKASGATVRRVTLYDDPAQASAQEMVDRLVKAVGPKTRAVAVTWVHSRNGVKMPIAEMGARLAELNAKRAPADQAVFCVDGVHGFGVENVAIPELRCDFFASGCHKWLMGPRGTGILWGRAAAQARAAPSIPTFADDESWGPVMTPGGFHPLEHRWALKEAFEFHASLGKANVEARVHALNRQLKEGLAKLKRVKLYTPMSDALSAGLTCFDVEGMTHKEVVERLRAKRVIGSETPYKVSYARLTPGAWNTPAEVDESLRQVRALAGG